MCGCGPPPKSNPRSTHHVATGHHPAETGVDRPQVFAAILDFFFIFIVAGFAIAQFSGGKTEGGFELNGAPAFALFGIVILYFIVFSRFLGGTLFQRLLGVR